MTRKSSTPKVHEHPNDATPDALRSAPLRIFTVDGDALTASGSFSASATLRVSTYKGGAKIDCMTPAGWAFLTRVSDNDPTADDWDNDVWAGDWGVLAAVLGWRIRVGSMG